MAAATDLLQEVGVPGTATTLSAPGYTIGNTSITVASTANWPTATGVTFVIDRAEVVNGEEVRVDGTYCEFVGTVNSGTQITNVSKVFGTAQDYSAGALTRVYIPVTAERENRLVEWGLVHADQDGTLKAGAVDSAAVLASDVVTTAKILDANVTTAKLANASITNAKLSTTAGEIGAAFQSWTPVFTNLNVANGTLAGQYLKVGRKVSASFLLTFGSTTVITGAGISTTLPVEAASYFGSQALTRGVAFAEDTAVAGYPLFLTLRSATSVTFEVQSAASTYVQTGALTATVPFAWGTGDKLSAWFEYEAAA